MGWTSRDIPLGEGMVYTMFQHDGHDIAGLGPQQPDQAGMPSVWNSYIAVDDADSLMGRVRELGGTVVAEPFDVFTSGRMAVIQDPTGAFVSMWQARDHIGSGLVNTPGAITWNELATRDPQQAQDFYSALLGWTFSPGPRPDYRMFYVGDRVNGGVIQMDDSWGDLPPHWMLYLSVKDIDEVVQKVPASGGKVHTGIMDAGTVGRFAVVSDPVGAVSTMIQVHNPDPWIEAAG
jgi:predicted enzyme related to lactoylglutathione lyase